MSFADREPLRHRYPHGPYSMLGPVEVTGAEPGDVIPEPYVHYFTFDDARTTAGYVQGIKLAVRRGGHYRAGSVRAGQRGGELPGDPVRQPDRVGLHLDAAQGGARGHPQSIFPADIVGRVTR
jgi:hypothetical protein